MKILRERWFNLLSVAVIFMATTLFSCTNDMEEIKRLAVVDDTIPSMYARDVSIIQSENGHLKYILSAPLLQRYESKTGPTIVFEEGFKVVFYDSLNPEVVRTEITAKYGINKESEKIMEAKSDVIVINHLKKEQLNTEHLVWNQVTKKVFSDVFVKITTPDKILYGEGMESDETFNRWSIRKPRGEMYINENQ